MLARDPESLDLAAMRAQFFAQGYARLGVWASETTIAALRQRSDDIMSGAVDHTPFFFQHDSPSGMYEDLSYGQGWRGPSRDYRKIEKLERDALFLAWLKNPLFARIARELIGGPTNLYRALLFAKSENGGTELPWHQDGGVFWGLDREPFLQIWTALDDAPSEAGCVEIFERSHLAGLATPDGGVVPRAWVERQSEPALALPAQAGEVILIHNHLWHRSRRNTTGKPRRAFTACLLSAETRCLRKKRAPREFFRVFE
jgi:hypothetical protein